RRTEAGDHRGVFPTAPHAPLPLGQLISDRLGLERFDHIIVKRRIVANPTALGKADWPTRLDDQGEVVPRLRHHSVVGPFGDDDVVTLAILEGAEVALQHPTALMDEVHLVSIAVAKTE